MSDAALNVLHVLVPVWLLGFCCGNIFQIQVQRIAQRLRLRRAFRILARTAVMMQQRRQILAKWNG